jgi:predicted  nucleic acid-binding Zn-ribbon protein
MGTNNATGIEKVNLEAHVELCAERYASLEEKLEHLEKRLTSLETLIVDIKENITNKTGGINKQIITIGTTVIGVMFTAIISLLIHLATK